MIYMNKRQIELLKLVGFKVSDNKITWRNISYSSIYFELFSIKIDAHTFNHGDYDSIEYLAIDLNHILDLVYELNTIKDGDYNE